MAVGDDPVAFVTGARTGIGRGLADHLMTVGWRVVATSRAIDETADARCLAMRMDVTDEDSVKAAMAAAREHFGRVDAVIANAGIGTMSPAMLLPSSSVRRILDVNVVGTATVVREALRMLRRSPRGRVVTMSSMAVSLALEGEAAYGASKAAVEHLTRVLAKELAPFGVTVNCVAPSFVPTDLTAGIPAEVRARLLARLPIQEPGSIDDVANVVDFLLAQKSRAVTGQVIRLGGA